MAGRMLVAALACALGAGPALAWAQGGGIYTCVDGKGRRITSDRPIVECIDREQKILNDSGTVRQTVGPTLTPIEQRLHEERKRQLADERQREADEKRRDRVLLARYPGRAEHDAERASALDAVAEVIRAAQQRIAELNAEHGRLQRERKSEPDAAKLAQIQRQLQENDKHLAAQQRFLANQEAEKQRINARFDAELAKLQQLWADRPAAAAATLEQR